MNVSKLTPLLVSGFALAGVTCIAYAYTCAVFLLTGEIRDSIPILLSFGAILGSAGLVGYLVARWNLWFLLLPPATAFSAGFIYLLMDANSGRREGPLLEFYALVLAALIASAAFAAYFITRAMRRR